MKDKLTTKTLDGKDPGEAFVVRQVYGNAPRIEKFEPSGNLRKFEIQDGVLVVLGQCLAPPSQLTDLAARAWHSDSFALLSSLPGSYSIVLLRTRQVVVLSDSVGHFPLFTVNVDGGVLVGTRPSSLAKLAGDHLDPAMLAARIACPDARNMFSMRTLFREVTRVPEGVAQVLGYRGTRTIHANCLGVDPNANFAETADRLRTCILDSIRTRQQMTTQLSTDFSGGLDSTSLAFLAASGGRIVHCLTSGPAEADDGQYALRFARLNSLIRHHLVPESPHESPFQDLFVQDDEPCAASIFTGPLRARLSTARALGADVHMVGEGGDVLFTAPPAHLIDFARQGDLPSLWRHCVVWGRLRTRSPQRLFRRAIALGAMSRRQSLMSLARRVDQGHQVEDASWEDDWLCCWRPPRANWLTARARSTLANEIRALATVTDGRQDESRGDMVTRFWLRSQASTQRAVRDAGKAFGVDVHAPFLDPAVVRVALSLTARKRVDVRTPKPLLRKALAGLVPDVVLSRWTKGEYVLQAFHGVKRAAPSLRGLLADSAAADYGVLDPVPVRKALDDAIRGQPTSWGPLNEVIATELWLRQVPVGLVRS